MPGGRCRPVSAPRARTRGPAAAARPEVPWLQPMPDALLRREPADPASIVTSRTSMRLALIAALQYLPARQRAVLILRDVLGWRAAEVAELLGTTHRRGEQRCCSAPGRSSAGWPRRGRHRASPPTPDDRALLDRYAAAFENADVAALMRVLREDAVLEMPPLPAWFAGPAQVGRFLGAQVLHRAWPVPDVPDRRQRPARVRRLPARATTACTGRTGSRC